MRRQATLGALLLVVLGVALGATVFRSDIAQATGPVDVVHGTAVAVPPTGVPLVMTIHDLAFLAEPGHVTRHGRRFFARGTELARRHAALVLCPSDATIAASSERALAKSCSAYGPSTLAVRANSSRA